MSLFQKFYFFVPSDWSIKKRATICLYFFNLKRGVETAEKISMEARTTCPWARRSRLSAAASSHTEIGSFFRLFYKQ